MARPMFCDRQPPPPPEGATGPDVHRDPPVRIVKSVRNATGGMANRSAAMLCLRMSRPAPVRLRRIGLGPRVSGSSTCHPSEGRRYTCCLLRLRFHVASTLVGYVIVTSAPPTRGGATLVGGVSRSTFTHACTPRLCPEPIAAVVYDCPAQVSVEREGRSIWRFQRRGWLIQPHVSLGGWHGQTRLPVLGRSSCPPVPDSVSPDRPTDESTHRAPSMPLVLPRLNLTLPTG